MKVDGLVTPEELRVQIAADEVFRVLSGGEADLKAEAQSGGVKLESSSSNTGTPAIVEAFRILSGGEADHSAILRLDEPDRSAEARVDAAELGQSFPGNPVVSKAFRLVRGGKADYSANEQFILAEPESSFSSQVEPHVRPQQRFSSLMIATAALVSFGLGVLVSQLFQEAGDDSVSASQTAYAAMSLEQERQRTAQLTTELAAARKDFQAQLQLSGDEIYEASQLKKSVEAVTAQLQRERENTAELMRRLESARPSIAACDAPDCVAKGQREPVVAPVEQPSTSETKMDPELVRLMGRANELLAQGDIGGARIVLERAVEMGSAKASFIIAETYDPRVLSGWKTYGTRGDLSKARQFYAKAAAGGIEEAKKRLASLAQN